MVTLMDLPLLFSLILFLILPSKMLGDVGKKCNLSLFCFGTNIYCDKSNTCRCKDGYPVLSDPHKCLAIKRYKERCVDPKQCSSHDPNSYCTQIPYQSNCDCLDEYFYNEKEEKCLKRSRKIEKPNLTLPLAVVISLAFSCMLCCCMVLLHLYRRRNNLLNSRNIGIFSNSGSARAQTGNVPTANDNTANLLQSPADPLPSYDAATSLQNVGSGGESVISESDCPPSYDEVMKGSVIKEVEVKETPA